MTFLDFAAIKQRANIEEVADMLGLPVRIKNNQIRCPCPTCKNGGDRALCITPAKAAFYCFAASKGGDVISLVAHVRDIPVKAAAQWLAERYGMYGTSDRTSTSTVTVPQSAEAKETQKFQPLAYLRADHEAVEAVGFDPAIAERLGIGYAPKGVLRGMVAVPIRDENGTLIAYIGITEATLPKSLQPTEDDPKVVRFPQTA